MRLANVEMVLPYLSWLQRGCGQIAVTERLVPRYLWLWWCGDVCGGGGGGGGDGGHDGRDSSGGGGAMLLVVVCLEWRWR